MTALAEGELVADVRSGLAIRGRDQVTPVLWPSRYSAARISGRIHLFDPSGRLVAREGDHIELGGGLGLGDFFIACEVAP